MTIDLTHPLAAFALTIIGGALTLTLGQILVNGFLNPALELKREIGKIAYSLVFYANRRYSVKPEEQSGTRDVFRVHAAKLRELLNTITSYGLWRFALGLPPESELLEASRNLIGHSNFPEKPDGAEHDRAREIRTLLKLQD